MNKLIEDIDKIVGCFQLDICDGIVKFGLFGGDIEIHVYLELDHAIIGRIRGILDYKRTSLLAAVLDKVDQNIEVIKNIL